MSAGASRRDPSDQASNRPTPEWSFNRKLSGAAPRKDDPARARIAGRDARLPQGQGRRVGRSTRACEQQQPGAVRIKPKNIITGDFWLTQPRSPFRVFSTISSGLLDRVAQGFDLAGITNPVGTVYAKIVKGRPPALCFGQNGMKWRREVKCHMRAVDFFWGRTPCACRKIIDLVSQRAYSKSDPEVRCLYW